MKRIAKMYICALVMCSVLSFSAGYMTYTPNPKTHTEQSEVKDSEMNFVVYFVPVQPVQPPKPYSKPDFVKAKFNRLNQDTLREYGARNLDHLVEKMSGTKPTQMANK